jgi:hypothetical protein
MAGMSIIFGDSVYVWCGVQGYIGILNERYASATLCGGVDAPMAVLHESMDLWQFRPSSQ